MPFLFALTLFASAFLLFLVQPMIAKMILPSLGGTASVWNTCMVFFQAALLAGYGYAHASTAWLGVRRQAALHVGVLLLPLLVLPIAVAGTWVPPADANPIPWLLALLVVSVGLPFFVVSTSAPLLQKWFAATGHRSARDPYFLYAASNLGSLAALACYRALFEPNLRLMEQSRFWAFGYGLLVVLTAACTLVVWRSPAVRVEPDLLEDLPDFPADITRGRRVRWVILAFVPSSLMLGVTTYLTTDISAVPLLWIIPLGLYLLSFVLAFSRMPSLLYRLFVLGMPLAILTLILMQYSGLTFRKMTLMLAHLTTFFLVAVVCHGALARSRPPARHLTEFYLWMSAGGVLGGLFNALVAPLAFNMVVEYQVAMVLACLVMPGLYPTRPAEWKFWRDVVLISALSSAGLGLLGHQARLTGLAVSRQAPLPGLKPGWAVAALVVCGVALAAYPLLTRRHSERLNRLLDVGLSLALGLLAAGLLLGLASTGWTFKSVWRPEGWENWQVKNVFVYGVLAVLCFSFVLRPARFGLGLAAILIAHNVATEMGGEVLGRDRSFFGVLKIDTSGPYHRLTNGTTLHGTQRFDPGPDPKPLSYYHHTGPIGQVIDEVHSRSGRPPFALIGLGAGTLAAYGEPGQQLDFYEIDPAVKQIATNPGYFTYVTDAELRGVDLRVILGDARLTLARADDRRYGLVVVDAFSSDSIPVHLITRQAVQLIFDKLADDGIAAYHISNRYLDLKPVLANLAGDLGVECLVNWDDDDSPPGKDRSEWVILARQKADFGKLAADSANWHEVKRDPKVGVWTDDFSNLLGVFRW